MVKKDSFLLWISKLVLRFIACKSEDQEFSPHCSLKVACGKIIFVFESVNAETGEKNLWESAEGSILTLLGVQTTREQKIFPKQKTKYSYMSYLMLREA